MAAKDHTGGNCFRDYAALFAGYGAFDISDRAPSLQNGALSPEPSLPDRPEEIHLQFDGGERFVWRQSACERHAYGSIRDVAKNAAVQCPHGICMLRSSSESDGSPALANVFCFEPDQTCYRNVIRPCTLSEIRSQGCILDSGRWLCAPVFARPARTLVSRYSSRWRLAQSGGSSLR
jgi:hypothetical protein